MSSPNSVANPLWRGARGTAAHGYWQNEAPVGYRRVALAPSREPVVLEIGQKKAKDQKVRLTLVGNGEERLRASSPGTVAYEHA